MQNVKLSKFVSAYSIKQHMQKHRKYTRKPKAATTQGNIKNLRKIVGNGHRAVPQYQVSDLYTAPANRKNVFFELTVPKTRERHEGRSLQKSLRSQQWIG